MKKSRKILSVSLFLINLSLLLIVIKYRSNPENAAKKQECWDEP